MAPVRAWVGGCGPPAGLPLPGPAELQEVTLEDSESVWHKDKILLVDVGGVISEEVGGGLFGGELTCSPSYMKTVLKKAANDERVKAVYLGEDAHG